MNSMEHYHKNNPDTKPDRISEKKPSRSLKIKRIFLTAVLGIGFLTSGCGVVDSRARANIEAAGIPPAVANDPDLIWAAMNGATAEELRDYANTISMKREMENSQARATQMAIDEGKQLEATPDSEQEEIIEQTIDLEKINEKVFSFVTNDNIEITDKNFIKRMKEALQKTTNTEIVQVFVAIPDDDFGVTRIFMDSTVESYKSVNGIFYAYPNDTIYVATDMSSLTQFLNSQGINYETFGLP